MMDEKINEILGQYPIKNREFLIPILQNIQETFSYIPEEAIYIISKQLKIAPSKIYGIATFYNEFSFTPKGKYNIKVCVGTGCHLAGAEALLEEISKTLNIKAGETSRDKLFSLEAVPCMGACNLAPVISINNQYYTGQNKASIKELLENIIYNQQ